MKKVFILNYLEKAKSKGNGWTIGTEAVETTDKDEMELLVQNKGTYLTYTMEAIDNDEVTF